MTDSIRVGIIDANEQVRTGRSMLVSSQNSMRLVLESGDPIQLLESIGDYLVDVLVIEVRVPGMELSNYLEALCSALISSGNTARLVLTSAFYSDELLLLGYEYGASMLCAQDQGPAALIQAIESLSGGHQIVTRQELVRLAANQAQAFAPNPMLVAAVNRVDERQRKVLEALLQGLDDAKIAKALDLTKYRVTKFIDSLCESLGMFTRIQLELALIRAGF